MRVSLHLAIALALSACLSLSFFAPPLRPWTDQGWMLQAAVRHARGEGLTTQLNNPSLDLTRPAFERLTYFPPGYPLLVSAMLRLGLGVEAAVKILNGLALVLGMAGWLLLALPHLEHRPRRVLYTALLVIACGGIITKGGTTDVLFWAGVPWWISCVARAREAAGRRQMALLTIAALINAALISVRWAAAVLVPVAVVAMLIPLRRHRMKGAIAVALPPTLTYLAIGAINRRYSSATTVLSFVEQGWHPRELLTLYPFESLFAVPLGLDPLFRRLWRLFDPPMQGAWGDALFRVALPLGLLVVLVVSARWPRTSLVLVIAALAAGLVVFLSWMSLRYNWDFMDWSFLREPRYYRPFLPAFLLAWLMLIDRLPPLRRRAFVALLALASIYLFQAGARREWSQWRSKDESLELVAEVRSLAGHGGVNVVFDIDISDYIIDPHPTLVASLYPDERSGHHIGQPATLWLVRRVNETSAYLFDRHADRRHFEALKERFGARRVWTSSAGSYEMHMARVIEAR